MEQPNCDRYTEGAADASNEKKCNSTAEDNNTSSYDPNANPSGPISDMN